MSETDLDAYVLHPLQYSGNVRAQVRHSVAPLWCIVLAAGGSSRLGRPKQLVRRKQRSLLAHAVGAAAAVAPKRVVVVLGAGAIRLRLALRRSRRQAIYIQNRRWQEGIATSLRAGLAALPKDARAALIVLSDQPRVGARALATLARAWRQRPGHAVVSVYGGGIGVPAILPRRLWRPAARLSGDVGARRLLSAEPRLVRVAVPEAELDIDTIDDLEKL
jgi:molybdenum cofactor cytidylyltransferase